MYLHGKSKGFSKISIMIVTALFLAGVYYYYYHIDTLSLSDLTKYVTDNKSAHWLAEKADFDTGLTRSDISKMKSKIKDYKKNFKAMAGDPDLAEIMEKTKKMPAEVKKSLLELLKKID